MAQSYEVRVLGPLPEPVRDALGPTVIGRAGTRTVLCTTAEDPVSLSAALSRLCGLGLEVTEVHREPHRAELEIGGPLGPCLRAALSDVTVSSARWRCVLSLRASGRNLAATLMMLTEQGVDLLSVRRMSTAAH